jgi:sec-independent protein translocase protein TatB
MFDVGFWELMVIAVVALIVIGPERLPGVARTAGLWVGRLRRFVAGVKADIEREVKAEELKRVMEEQAKSSGIHEIIEETRSVAGELNRTVALDQDAATAQAPAAQPNPALSSAASTSSAAVDATPEKQDPTETPKHHG